MLARMIAMAPPSVVRAVGRLQHRNAFLGRVIRSRTASLTNREGVVRHGVGRGLAFNATGGFPGYLLGTSEPEEQQLLAATLSPGDVFYDIGCNIGFFTTIAGRLVGPGGAVFGFEPTPDVAEMARHNASLNGFGHVSITQVAVSDEAGELWLKEAESSPLNSLSAQATAGGIRVEAVAIDTWREQHGTPRPSMVTVDVEGAELHVLRGMMDTIRASKPLMLIEVHWLGDAFLDFVANDIVPMGYTLRALDGDVPTDNVRWHAMLLPT